LAHGGAFADARVFVAEGIDKRAGQHIDFDAEPLEADKRFPWDAVDSFRPKAFFV
jgi:hypothetical protein